MKFPIAILVLVSACSLPVLMAQQPKPSWDGIYTDAQAERGKALYTEFCRECHGDANGTPRAPAVMGPAFAGRWQKQPVRELFEYMHSRMPYNSPGGLTRAQNADILAFMLKMTQVPVGTKDFVPPAAEGEGSPARGVAFYTEDQALRGKFAFERHCGRCHNTAKNVQTLASLNAPHDAKGLGGTYALSFGTPFLSQTYFGKPLFPSAYYLFDKMRNMPPFDTHSISAETRADILAYILQANDFPAGRDELKPDPELMKQMMLQEPGFERMFNGKDLSGIKVVYGPDCAPGPEGCGKTDTSSVLRVENGKLVCDCNIHGFWYTEKKYKDFDFRFEFRFVKPADWDDGQDDELYFGGGGVLIFIHDDYKVFPNSIEVELRWHDLGDIFALRPTQKVSWTYDHAAKARAGRAPWQWNEMRIVSKGARVDSYLNGVLISTISDHNLPAGQLGFQLEGAATEWRNLRVKGE